MRPLTGVVLNIEFDKVKSGSMEVLLEAGNKINVKLIDGAERGSKVEIAYDFTRDRVRDVRLFGEKDVPSLEEPQFPETEDIIEDVEPEAVDVSDQVGIDPEVEEWEDEKERFEFE
jgi:hypothetical protein